MRDALLTLGWKNDEARWQTIEEALRTTTLTDSQRLFVISLIVESRKPYDECDLRRTLELAKQYGWETRI